MRHHRIITAALAASAVVAVGASPAVSAKKKDKVTELACTLELVAQGTPNPSGTHLGFAVCPRPFGRGLHYSAYTVTKPPQGPPTIAGTFKNYYDRGTASGTVAMTVAATSPTDLTYSGTVTYTGGTGAFKHVRGTGSIRCTTSDGGTHKACTVNSTLTGL